jgi:hypothetical protein
MSVAITLELKLLREIKVKILKQDSKSSQTPYRSTGTAP